VSSIDKKYVREEVNKVKSDFDALCESGKISPESKVLFSSMFMIMNLILSIFMERTTRKNSKNSSIPSSQSDPDTSTDYNSKTNSKGKNDNNDVASNSKTTQTTIVVPIENCNCCGQNIEKIQAHAHERRTKIDIIFEKVVTHIDAEIKACPNCKSDVKALFPSDMHGPLQYGNGLKAYTINLAFCQMISLVRVQKLIKAMIGQTISQASILKYIWTLHNALEDWETRAKQQILFEPAINADETGFNVKSKEHNGKHWIHIYCANDITLKFLHKSRGKEAINDIGIIPKYSGVVIHDCWASYFSYENNADALCGSHLLRDLVFIEESNNYKWAIDMQKLLKETCHKVSSTKSKKLSNLDYLRIRKKYKKILAEGKNQIPEVPIKPKSKRGRVPKSDAHNLLERLEKYENAVLLFAKDSNVSFTNNRAERDLRMAKVKQKVSGCFRTYRYAAAYCRITSYLQTMANKGINPLIAIETALTGKIG
jgi:hypothetical protein